MVVFFILTIGTHLLTLQRSFSKNMVGSFVEQLYQPQSMHTRMMISHFINCLLEQWGSIPRGWYREAALAKKFRCKEYYVQTTTWKNCKQVIFLHTVNIGSSRGMHTVRRNKRGHSGRELFPAPLAQLDYAENYAAVDQNDRSSADYSTSMRTNRFYFHIFFGSSIV